MDIDGESIPEEVVLKFVNNHSKNEVRRVERQAKL